jgi:hypothetical protein
MPSRARSARTLSCFLRAPNVVARYDRIRSSTAHLAACGFSIEMGVSEICASSTARLRMRLEIVMDFTRSLKSVLSRSTARSILSPAARHAREARYSQWTSAGDRMWVGDLDSASSVGLTGSGLGYFQQRRWPILRNVGSAKLHGQSVKQVDRGLQGRCRCANEDRAQYRQRRSYR